MFEFAQWEGFTGKEWKESICVRKFIRANYTPYEGDSSFLCGTCLELSVIVVVDSFLALWVEKNRLLLRLNCLCPLTFPACWLLQLQV